jgi:O-antigen ligase/tetratricopeptide (TPR) repeat protein
VEIQNARANIYKRALEIIWLAVIFLVPLFFNPQSVNVYVLNKALLLQFLVVIMLAFWVADLLLGPGGRRQTNWRSFFISPLNLSILVFGLINVAATVISITPAISFWGSWDRKAGLFTLLCWILFFLILTQQIRNRKQLLKAVYTLLLSSAIVSIVGILQSFLPEIMLPLFSNKVQVGGRIISTIGNPLFLSSFLAMVIPFTLALMAYSWDKRQEGNNRRIFIGLIFLLALQFWCLWLAQYSITILVYVIAPIVFLILLGIARRKKILLIFGALSLVVMTTVAGLLVIPLLFSSPSAETSATRDIEPALVSEELGLKTLNWRVQYWKGAAEIIIKSPEVPFSNDTLHTWRKLIGYGPETFTYTFQLFYPDDLKSTDTNSRIYIDRPHNDYLYLASTRGILGLLSFLSILAVFFYLCFRYFRRTDKDIDKLFLLAMVAGMLQYMTDIFFNISTVAPELVFWLMLAMTYSIGRFLSAEQQPYSRVEGMVHNGVVVRDVSRVRSLLALGCALILIVASSGLSVRPFVADIYLQKGLKLEAMRNEQPIYPLDKATQLTPEEPICWHAIGAYSYYLARHARGDAARTELLTLTTSAYERARELEPYFVYRYLFMADAYTFWAESGSPDKWAEAMPLYNAASQLFPGNAVIMDRWALALIVKGDRDAALAKLDLASSFDPEWAQTYFLNGLVLAIDGNYSEAGAAITAPIKEQPYNVNYYIDLCMPLMQYNVLGPLNNGLERYVQEVPDDWTAHALLGTSSLFENKLEESVDEFNTAMMLVPAKDAGELFGSILRLTSLSTQFKTELGNVASGWRDKLIKSPDSNIFLPQLEQLAGASK